MEGLDGNGTIFGGICVGKAWPGVVVAGFEGGQPGGFDWEACGGVEVADERANAGEVVGVEGNRAVFLFEGGGVAILGAQRESPKFCSGGLAVSSQENGAVLRENRDYRFFKQDTAVVVTQGADSNQVVVEIGHDMSGGSVQVGEEDVAGGGGEMGGAAGGADDDFERIGVYVGARGFWREVETTGAGVCDYSIGGRCDRGVGYGE